MRLVRTALPLLLAAAMAACPAARPADEGTGVVRSEPGVEGNRVQARIVNSVHNSLRVYVHTETESSFLGSVRPAGRETFVIPRGILGRRTQVRFRAEPVGPRGRYWSDWIHVEAGDVVEWQVFGRPR